MEPDDDFEPGRVEAEVATWVAARSVTGPRAAMATALARRCDEKPSAYSFAQLRGLLDELDPTAAGRIPADDLLVDAESRVAAIEVLWGTVTANACCPGHRAAIDAAVAVLEDWFSALPFDSYARFEDRRADARAAAFARTLTPGALPGRCIDDDGTPTRCSKGRHRRHQWPAGRAACLDCGVELEDG